MLHVKFQVASPENEGCRRRLQGYEYYLTVLAKQVVAPGLKLKELVIIPQLAAVSSR